MAYSEWLMARKRQGSRWLEARRSDLMISFCHRPLAIGHMLFSLLLYAISSSLSCHQLFTTWFSKFLIAILRSVIRTGLSRNAATPYW